jgi:hypothetical protein
MWDVPRLSIGIFLGLEWYGYLPFIYNTFNSFIVQSFRGKAGIVPIFNGFG